jgi:hypothetical protein
MPATESGIYRVFDHDFEDDAYLLVEKGTEEPMPVRTVEYDEPLQSTVDSLLPGHLVAATVEWPPEGHPFFVDLSVETRTVFEFVDGLDDIFEEAEKTFQQGVREHMAISSNVTYGTDGEPNGAIYTFAKQDSEKDIFEELRTGKLTMEPMIEKLGDGGADPPYEVFVLRPEDADFIVVYLTLEKNGLLARTIREEYDCPAPWQAV